MTFLFQREGENYRRKHFMINLYERVLPNTAQPSDHRSDAHLTELPRPANLLEMSNSVFWGNIVKLLCVEVAQRLKKAKMNLEGSYKLPCL